MLIEVDNAVSYQTINSFGANKLSLVFPNSDHLGPLRERAVKAAFGEVRLSLGLLNIGIVETPAGGTELFGQRANDNGELLVLDTNVFNFVESDTLREKVLMSAAAFGYSDVTLGPLLNLQAPLSWLIPIRTADYSDYWTRPPRTLWR